MSNDTLFISTVNKVNSLITEIHDDKLLLSSICGYLKNNYSIETAIFENNDVVQTILFDNRSKETVSTSFQSEFMIVGNKYDISIYSKNEELKITTEYFNFLITTFLFIIRNLKNKENTTEESSIKDVKNVLNKLSFTELTVVVKIFNEYNCEEFTIIASNVAQKHNFTRSSIVNALRKLESAMIIESYSLGVKGTHIKIINNYFRKEINKLI